MNDIYLTSTFTNPWNVEFNFRFGPALEAKGIKCFLPHRDTNQKGPEGQRFSEDLAGMRSSKIILAVAINESPNWGAEVGYAYGIGIPVLALTDKNHKIPLICGGMITDTFYAENLDLIDSYIDPLVEKVKEILSTTTR